MGTGPAVVRGDSNAVTGPVVARGDSPSGSSNINGADQAGNPVRARVAALERRGGSSSTPTPPPNTLGPLLPRASAESSPSRCKSVNGGTGQFLTRGGSAGRGTIPSRVQQQ